MLRRTASLICILIGASATAQPQSSADWPEDKKGAEELIQKRLRQAWPLLDACYQSELSRGLLTTGEIKIDFKLARINKDSTQGRVIETLTVKNTIGSSEVSECMEAYLRILIFPTSPPKGAVTSSYSMRFRAPEKPKDAGSEKRQK